MTKRISFEVLEPLMFKSASEFAPGVSGPHAHAESVPLPYPSTVAGTLSTLVLESNPKRIPTDSSWDEQMSSLLGCETKLRGPYIFNDDEIFVQCYGAVLKLEEALERARAELALQEVGNEHEAKKNIVESLDVVGIKLKDSKATDEQMLYFARMVDYSPMGKRKAICFDIIGDAKSIEKISFPKIVKFGGEGRASKVSIESGPNLISMIKKNAEKADALYVASPVVFKADSSCGDNLEEKLKQQISNDLGGIDVERIIGRVDLLGMGFFTAKRQRKPICGAIFPGSVIQLEKQSTISEEICELGIGEFSRLGYGTVIPLS